MNIPSAIITLIQRSRNWVAFVALCFCFNTASAANIRVVNYTDDLTRFVPVASPFSGRLMTANSGSVQIGYFNTLTDATIPGASRQALAADFVAFGGSSVIGDLAQGAFDSEKSVVTPEGSPFIGKSIYVLIGSGPTFETSEIYYIAKDNDTFPQDNPASEALVNLTETENTTWLVGAPTISVRIDDGIFNGEFLAISVELIPEPGSLALLIGSMGIFLRRQRGANRDRLLLIDVDGAARHEKHLL